MTDLAGLSASGSESRRRALRLVAVFVALGLGVFVSYRGGTPPDLPDVAQSSPFLFHLTRAGIGLSILGLVFLFGWLGIPSEVRGVRWGRRDDGTKEAAGSAIAVLEYRVKQLEALNGIRSVDDVPERPPPS